LKVISEKGKGRGGLRKEIDVIVALEEQWEKLEIFSHKIKMGQPTKLCVFLQPY
jgi:hypothetical protein